MGSIRTLQIGLEWFPERAGGLPRIYYDLYHASLLHDVGFRGLLSGSSMAAADTNGAIEAFSTSNRPVFSRLLAARAAIKRVIAEYKPDIVASHFALHTVSALDVIDRPLVIHFHGPWAMESGVDIRRLVSTRIKFLVEAVVYRRAQRCIVLSKAFGTILHESYGVPWDRIIVIPGAVNVERFSIVQTPLQARASLGWPTDRPIILAVRRLINRMGLENLIQAVADVAKSQPDVLLMIGGKGPLLPKLETLVAELNLENHVRMVGFVRDEDLPIAYRAANFSIVPTLALEGFGLIAAESLAVGTPVLVTPVGGLPEVVQALSKDLILEGTAPSDLRDGICRALDGSSVLPDSEACKSYAQANFSWARVMRQIKSTYSSSLG